MFYKRLIKQKSSKNNVEKQDFINSLDSKTLTNQQSDLCKNKMRENDLFDSTKSTRSN